MKDKQRKNGTQSATPAHNPNHIYDKAARTWFDVTPEQFEEYDRWRTRIRRYEQYHCRCKCPRGKWWLCDGMCQDCEFHTPGNIVSLDTPIAESDGEAVTLGDTLADPASMFDSILCDKAEMDMLFARLQELMPEARQIGLLRQQGLTDGAIAGILQIKRTTLLSRLKKVREQLAAEFPDCF